MAEQHQGQRRCTSTWPHSPPSSGWPRSRARRGSGWSWEAYTYGHFPIVAGIVLSALGVEGVLAHADETKALGGFSAAALFGGVALYLAGELVFKQRLHGTLSLPRLVAIGVLLAGLVVILAALISSRPPGTPRPGATSAARPSRRRRRSRPR